MAGAAGQAGGGAGVERSIVGVGRGDTLSACGADWVRGDLRRTGAGGAVRSADAAADPPGTQPGVDAAADPPGTQPGVDAEHVIAGSVGSSAGTSDGAGGCGLWHYGGGAAGRDRWYRADGGVVHQHAAGAGAADGRGGSAGLAGRIAGAAVAPDGAPASGVGGDPAFGGVGRSVRHADGV